MKYLVMALMAIAGLSTLLGVDTDTDSETEEHVRMYVGTYTGGESEGIYVLDLNLKTGALTVPRLAARTDNPSFLAVHPRGDLLYAVNEVGELHGARSGGVSAFKIDKKTGSLTLLNQQLSLGGAPCYLTVDKAGSSVLVANYTGGSVAVLPIETDGNLGEASSFVQHTGSSVNRERQQGPHAHSINLDAGNKFALAADLGLDKVLVYRFDPGAGTLTANDPPYASLAAGAGPRHLVFHPDGRFAYVVNELDLTVTAFAYDADAGELTEVQTISTLPDSVTARPNPSAGYPAGYSTAEIQVHPSGRFLYASNRGHDTIAVFTIDQETGELTSVENEPTQGRTPRNFGIDPTGRYLLAANQNSDSIVVFSIDQDSGELTPTGETAVVPTPVCVKFVG